MKRFYMLLMAAMMCCLASAQDCIVTAYATNSDWTYGTDYTINASAATREGTPVEVTLTESSTAGRMQFTIPTGATYTCWYVPSAAREAEGYVSALKSATVTSASNNASMAIPMGGEYSITVPTAAGLQLGIKLAHFRPFMAVEPIRSEVVGANTVYTYKLAVGQQYNYRTWMTGGLTQGGIFYYQSDATKRPTLVFTDADYQAKSPKFIDHDVKNNGGYNVADIYLNINPQGHLKLNSGDKFDLTAFRTWQIVESITNNYFIDPDFHYTVTSLTPGKSADDIITLSNPNTGYDTWSDLVAVGNGTALVTVTYDAIALNQYANNATAKTAFVGGEYWSAIWPENTGVFVVTVGENTTGLTTNFLVNNAHTNPTAEKLAGDYIDADFDVFYYAKGTEGYAYTFTPQGASNVKVAYPTIGTNEATYTGFGAEGVTKNEDGSYTVLLKHGRQIVAVYDATGKAEYQVLNAKEVELTATNTTRPGATDFMLGENVEVKFNTLYHPAHKLAGIHNFSAVIDYANTNGATVKATANQYMFASTDAAQKLTITLPMSGEKGVPVKISGGALKITGFGDPVGNHRGTSRLYGRNANFTAVQHACAFGVLPELVFNVEVKEIPLTFMGVDGMSVIVRDPSGNVVAANEQGSYTLGAYGTYRYEATAPGYGTARDNLVIDSEKAYEVNVVLPKVTEQSWDGTTTKEPAKDANNVYQIGTGYELAWLAANSNGKSAVLTADIDLAGFQFSPIGIASASAFNGTFDGQGHAVYGLYINAAANTGLFGYINAATIKNLEVYGEVHGTASVAGIAGYVNGACTFENVANHADVYATTAASYVAGIAGNVRAATTKITNAYNTGKISGTNFVAGIYNYFTSAANATVTNVFNVGEIVGTQTGAIRALASATTSTGKITNAYAIKAYFNDTKTTIVTPAQMASGEIAVKLGEAFGQTLGEDAYPVLGEPKVYYDTVTKTYYNESNAPFQTRVLTFEDVDYKGGKNFAGGNNWSSLIDNPQYSGKLLYGETGMGYFAAEDAYTWTDEKNTGLSHTLPENWGSFCYWGGGHAISNYVSGEEEKYGSYNEQLTVYKEGVNGIQQTAGGHNGSNNFAVHYGYTDNSGYSGSVLPALCFADGKERYIDYMYINNICYAINVFGNGNGLSDKIKDTDWVKVLAIGYNAKGQVTDTASIFLCNGPKNVIHEWTKFDLSSIGKVARVEFNVTGSSDNGYGFSQPAYFAYDDVAVRFYPEDYLIDPTPNVDVTGCVTFEDLNMDDNSFKNDILDFQSGDFYFSNYYDETYYSWNGFAPSTMAANTFTSYDDQYNNCVGGGMNSKTFAMGYYSEYNALMDDEYPAIYEKEYSLFTPEFVYVTNSANDVMSMLKGDAYAKKFTNEDYLKLIITGLDADFEEGESVEFYLAKDGEIVTGWQKIDLTKLGKVMMLQFTLESSDVSWGFINTPCYFAIDNFKAKVEKTGTDIQNIKVDTATKRVHNGQLYILRDGVIYNAQGVVIR